MSIERIIEVLNSYRHRDCGEWWIGGTDEHPFVCGDDQCSVLNVFEATAIAEKYLAMRAAEQAPLMESRLARLETIVAQQFPSNFHVQQIQPSPAPLARFQAIEAAAKEFASVWERNGSVIALNNAFSTLRAALAAEQAPPSPAPEVRPEHRHGFITEEEFPDGCRIHCDHNRHFFASTASNRDAGCGLLIQGPTGDALRFTKIEDARAALYAIGQGPASLPKIDNS
jgi:hypothetical protein